MQPTYQPTKPSGFTLVEMLVVAPLIVLVIATIVGFLLSLVGNVLIANSRTQNMYDIQDALNQIEQDTFYSTGFLDTLNPPYPHGKDASTGTGAFNSTSATDTDIIFDQPATDKNPMDPARSLVYYSNPNGCDAQMQLNASLKTNIVYFLRTVNDIKSLYRRSIVPVGQATCATPWQRNSCSISHALCVTNDARLVDNVSTMTVTYFKKSDPGVVVAPALADSIRVGITTAKTVSGEPITSTLEVSASRFNK